MSDSWPTSPRRTHYAIQQLKFLANKASIGETQRVNF